MRVRVRVRVRERERKRERGPVFDAPLVQFIKSINSDHECVCVCVCV